MRHAGVVRSRTSGGRAITESTHRPTLTPAKVVLALVTGLIDAAGIAAALFFAFFVTGFLGVCTDHPAACADVGLLYALVAGGVAVTIWLWVLQLRQPTLRRRALFAVGSTLPSLLLVPALGVIG